jgi:hypothetical protein
MAPYVRPRFLDCVVQTCQQYLHVILDELCCPDTSLHVKADVNFNFSLLISEFYYRYL